MYYIILYPHFLLIVEKGAQIMLISDMRCRTAKPSDKPYKISDGEGLYLLVMPTGAKYWRFRYRINDKEKPYAIGVYPTISLLEAREKRQELRKLVKDGFDPGLLKVEKKYKAKFEASQTFELVALEWYKKQLAGWKPRYAATILHRLKKYVFPVVGQFPINQISAPLILGCLERIEVTAPDMARRMKQLISYIFEYAKATGRVEINPAVGIGAALKKYKKTHFKSIEVNELPQLLISIHNCQPRVYRQTYLAVKLMLLTFVRTQELICARWDEIDFDEAMWIIPAERMKMGKTHIVPLSRQSLEILRELKAMNGHLGFVFPSLPKPDTHMSNGTILMALRRMNYGGKMTGHGFRSLALGVLKEKLSFTHEVADRQLAHVPKDGGTYDRAKFLPQRIEMMQKFADYLDDVFLKEIMKARGLNLRQN